MGRMIGDGGIQVGPGGRGRGTGSGTAGATSPPPPTPLESSEAGMKAWKPFEWNTVRVRVEGDVPHATVWINGVQVSDATDTENHALGGMIEGPSGCGSTVVLCAGSRADWRWRNIGIRELK
jgi:hypothetical protein